MTREFEADFEMTLAQIGATLAAAVASMLTMFGIIVVRGTKISEFRQKWIDEQRQDIATLVSNALQIASDPTNKRDERFLAFDIAASRINLRENPTKPEWADLLENVRELRIKLSATPPRPINISAETAQIIQQSNLKLKAEWMRVRAGELGYRIFYRLIWSLIGVVTFLALMMAFLNLAGYAVNSAI